MRMKYCQCVLVQQVMPAGTGSTAGLYWCNRYCGLYCPTSAASLCCSEECTPFGMWRCLPFAVSRYSHSHTHHQSLLLLPHRLLQANDVYAIINAVPAIALCLYGFLTPTMTGSLCFGAGLGITLFGIAYMFVHDGLVHKRFPTGPIAELPYMKRVTVAHKLHHAEKYKGVPWGLFLGPQVSLPQR
eukprot:GHRQ01018514.1.p1 GENE.GHRQ01018514.1~~GHRQ01018514.1.p1  ORF type:complete len:186 (-),score=43.20 GHRQ01018514.1:257-814(-)